MAEEINTQPKPLHKGSKEESNSPSRETWDNQCEFFLSCLGFAVGFGNLWRFPFLCYKNGGAVFIIPYLIMLLVAGLPMFFLELAVGQYVSLGPNILFQEIAPVSGGVGWAMLVITGMTSIYYNMVFAWSLFYTFASFSSPLPWTGCDNDYNTESCFTYEESLACRNQSMYYYNLSCHSIHEFCNISGLQSYNESHCHDPTKKKVTIAEEAVYRISSSEDYYKNRMLGVTGKTWEDMGGLRWELVGCLALAWTIICICMIKGVKSSGKVVYFSAIFPYVVLIILFIRGITLKGAYDGIEFYFLKPNVTKLTEIQVWNDAATQIFYSLSISFGGLITLASYNKFRNNCMRDAIVICLANCATSIFAGFVIFSILGFMSSELNIPVKDVVDSGSGLAFIAYPTAVARMPYPTVWAILFFTMFITLGIDSQFTYVETVSTGIFDQFESLRKWKAPVMILLSVVMFLLGLPMCLDGGVYLFELLNYYSGSLAVLFVSVCEVLCVVYLYGYKRFMENITTDMGISIPRPLYAYWTVTWLLLTPLSLLVILGFGVYFFADAQWGDYVYPTNIQAMGWLTIVAGMAPIPIFAFYKWIKNGKESKGFTDPSNKFCPAHLRVEVKGEPTTNESARVAYTNNGYTVDIGA